MSGISAQLSQHQYLVALGSNRRHIAYGLPRNVIRQAFAALDQTPIHLLQTSQIVDSAAIGPSQRLYANAAAIVKTSLCPPELLSQLKSIERQFGKRHARPWASRTLDLDIILWRNCPSGRTEIWADKSLTIPHLLMDQRKFVLEPAAQIAGKWRNPLTQLNVHQTLFRHYKAASNNGQIIF